MIYPKEFLLELDKLQHKIIYARVTCLTKDERPLEAIEGQVTGGSITLDGTSSVRRACQLSVAAEDSQLTDYYWTLNSKIKVAIGVANTINSSYPEIIWFEQGVFVITQFSQSYSATACTVSISGQDKMCLLNGTYGGVLNSSVDFGTIDEETKTKGVWRKRKRPIKDIVRDMIHQYGNEPFHNIIINDLDEQGLVLQEYRYDTPMYLFRLQSSNDYFNGTLHGEQEISLKNGSVMQLKDLDATGFIFDPMHDIGSQQVNSDVIYFNDPEEAYCLAKIDFGETAGYTPTDLVYPSELIANPGDTIESVLKKIVNFLGGYEYFYNLYGQFVFQKKKIEENNTENIVYNFENNEFITVFNNSPDIKNIKNDFTVWGERPTGVPIHLRYAIDKKPIAYASITVSDNELEAYNKKYDLDVKGQMSCTYILQQSQGYSVQGDKIYINTNYDYDPLLQVLHLTELSGKESGSALYIQIPGDHNAQNIKIVSDWRELIYQMAMDYQKYNHLDDFERRVEEANNGLYPRGRTGYEQYYIDMAGFWRQIYDPELTIDEDTLNRAQSSVVHRYQEGLATDVQDNELAELIDKIDNKNAPYYAYEKVGAVLNTNREINKRPEYSQAISSYAPVYATKESYPLPGQEKTHWLLKTKLSKPKEEINLFQYYKVKPDGLYNANNLIYSFAEDADNTAWNTNPLRRIYFETAVNLDSLAQTWLQQNTECCDHQLYGSYQLKAVPQLYALGSNFVEPTLQFYSQNQAYDSFRLINTKELMYYCSDPEELFNYVYSSSKWENQLYRYIDFRSPQFVTKKFYEWFLANSTKVTYALIGNWTTKFAHTFDNNLYGDNIIGRQLAKHKYLWCFGTGQEIYDQHYYELQDDNLTKVYCLEAAEWTFTEESLKNADEAILHNLQQYHWDESGVKMSIPSVNYITDLATYTFIIDNALPNTFDGSNYLKYSKINNEHFGWARSRIDEPQDLIFDIDFLDTSGELGQYAIPLIGHRPKVENDKEVKSLYYLDTPNIIFTNEPIKRSTGYRYFNAPGLEDMFVKSAQGKSAIDTIHNLLYQYGYIAESVTITSIPIYYLEPNSRIIVSDPRTNLNREYIVSRLTLPLTYNGTMNITATRAQPQLL